MIHRSAFVDDRAILGDGVSVWANAQVREFAQIGARSSLGIGAYVGPGVVMGSDCKIQNSAMIYEPAHLADGVFIGPGVILTNDRHPRAVTPQGIQKAAADWDAVGVSIAYGASVGAGAICVAPISIGQWATIAAGAVVTTDVAPHAIMAGVPAKRIGWVGRLGVPLQKVGDDWRCPVSGDLYEETGAGVIRRPE